MKDNKTSRKSNLSRAWDSATYD